MFDNRRPVECEKHQQVLSKRGFLADEDIVSDLRAFPKMSIAQLNSWKVPTQISGPARIQLFRCCAEQCDPLEKEALREIDRLVKERSDDRSRTADPIVPAFCIRRLALHYRRMMKRYQQFGKSE